MFSFQQTKLFIILGIVLLVCFIGLGFATKQIQKQKSAATIPAPVNPQITRTQQPTPTPATFRVF